MTGFRLPRGGRIDRSRSLRFTFDGRSMEGHPGDTLASALLANGMSIVGRSFKYHRPRGILTAGSSEPNALVTLGEGARIEPNTRATMVELTDGLVARSQNCWPSAAFDIGAVNGLLAPFLSAGFYYKTFMWPAPLWEKLYEPLIRKAAGLGRASKEPDPDRYEKSWAHADLLVIGAGPAGLAAALTAGRAGARVILLDEDTEPGGSLLHKTGEVHGRATSEFLAGVVGELSSLPNVRLLTRTTAVGWYDDNVFGAVERARADIPDGHAPRERLWRIVAREAILATGAEERPLVFGGNDRPGVMMAGAVSRYLARHAVTPGGNPLIFTTNGAGYRTASALEAAGIAVAGIVDPRPDGGAGWRGRAPVHANTVVADVLGGRGVRGAILESGGRRFRVAADALAMSGGFSPRIHLACQRGSRPVWSEAHGAFLAPERQKGLAISGSAAGIDGVEAALHDGSRKAALALAELGFATKAAFEPAPETMSKAFTLWRVAGAKGAAFVDFQNDVKADDLLLAEREGYGHVELAKRYTTAGMATDQGKTGNLNAIGILAEARGVTPAEIGTTTFRPFYVPVSFGALAGPARGRQFQPVRLSPLHGWAEKNGAVFVESGLWYRSSWFPRAGETTWRESVDREVLNVRANAGLCDVSTLGKIEIFGKDAATFLDRIYCNAFAKLPVGRARYGIMLRDDGFVYDDGTTSRLAEDHFFMTTTTALAAGVLSHLEFCAQTLWPDLDVRFASSTDQWAQMAIAGPKSRAILAEIVDTDLSDEAFPFMAAREITLFGGRIAARLFRISFSGERAYELAVPAGYGEAVADALMEAGAPHGLCAYGAEALGVLRIEKGHVTHNEINGTVTADDLGFGRMVSGTKPDFIGRTMLKREGLIAADRPQLVGIRPVDPKDGFKAGSHILRPQDATALENDQGYVTSVAYSPHLGHVIGLALVKGGRARHGERIIIWNALGESYVEGEICAPCFVDPANEQLHA